MHFQCRIHVVVAGAVPGRHPQHAPPQLGGTRRVLEDVHRGRDEERVQVHRHGGLKAGHHRLGGDTVVRARGLEGAVGVQQNFAVLELALAPQLQHLRQQGHGVGEEPHLLGLLQQVREKLACFLRGRLHLMREVRVETCRELDLPTGNHQSVPSYASSDCRLQPVHTVRIFLLGYVVKPRLLALAFRFHSSRRVFRSDTNLVLCSLFGQLRWVGCALELCTATWSCILGNGSLPANPQNRYETHGNQNGM
mmetsp:Transcript_31420/g.59048  ORF Transcript_31420/g.59048 Transcript_31420/m.59048 type:complete len:251 (-) Transcript_31420:222-974(-)